MNNAKFVNMGSKELEEIAEAAKNSLIEEYNIHIPQSKAIATIAYAFIKECTKELKEDDEDINVLEMFTVGKHDGELVTVPGQEFKLLIKDDK